MPPTLSVCLIARDEAANLPRAIASVRAIADEIVVLDTGSTDGTEQLARAAGASVRSFEWRDDFAAAINENLSQARCDWILRLDADEELLAESIPLLRDCLADRRTLAYFILRQDLVDAGRLDVFSEMWVERLFRRCPDIQFVGRCHAHPMVPLDKLAARDGMIVRTCDVRLRHYGYIGALKQSKLHRAAKLLSFELEERPGDLYYLTEYGRTLLLLGDPAGHEVMSQAMQLVALHADASMPPSPLAAAVLEHALLVGPDRRPALLNSARIADLIHRWFPRSAPLLWSLAKEHFTAEGFHKAAELLQQIVELKRTDSYDKSISFDPRLIGDDAAFNLAVCYVRLGRLDEAIALFESLDGSVSRGAAARQNLDVVRGLRDT